MRSVDKWKESAGVSVLDRAWIQVDTPDVLLLSQGPAKSWA